MESERLKRLRSVFAQASDEYKAIHAEVEELTEQEVALHKKQQDAVYVRNALQGAISSLRTAINNLAAIEAMESEATRE